MNKNKAIVGLTLLIATLGRILPHPWNMVPTISLSLIVGRRWSLTTALPVTLLSFFIADVVLAISQHHAVLGPWSWWTYSALVITTVLARRWPLASVWGQLSLVLLSSIGFWTWTNLGCWLSMPEYSLSLDGLVNCFIAALPFLKNQLFGDLAWSACLNILLQRVPAPQTRTQSVFC